LLCAASNAPPPRSRPAACRKKSSLCPSRRKKGDPLLISVDEHPRADTTLEALTKLKGVVKPEGTVTAGNASGHQRRRLRTSARFRGRREKARPHAEGPRHRRSHRGSRAAHHGHGPSPRQQKSPRENRPDYPANGRDRTERSLRLTSAGRVARTESSRRRPARKFQTAAQSPSAIR